MNTITHLIWGSIFVLFSYFYFDNLTFGAAMIIWLSSWFFIDLDHVSRYSLKKKDYNPFEFWRWSKAQKKKWKSLKVLEKRKYKLPVFLFHSVECLAILGVLSLFYGNVLWIIVGFSFHLIFDWIYQIYYNENVLMKISILYVLLYNRKRKDFD